MKQRHYIKDTIADIQKAQDDLKTAATNIETFIAWCDTCSLTFYDLDDKIKKYPKNINQVMEEYRQELKHRMTPEETIALLQYFIDVKNDYKENKNKELNLKIVKGPKYTREALEFEKKPIDLRDELLKINAKDINLFQNFKLCGDQLILVEGTDVELLTEDLAGRVSVNNKLFIKGNIANRVQDMFMTKISMYYEKLATFLSTFTPDEIEMDLDNNIIETPIEDFIQTELPTKFLTYYDIIAVYQIFVVDKKRCKTLHHFELKRKIDVKSFDEIFNYTLENWKKYKRCIQGQDQFLAWSNDPSKIAVSHWVPEIVNRIPEPWQQFLDEKMNKHLQMRLICYLGMCMDETNSAQQYLIISDKGGTGKGVMMRAIESALPKRAISSIDENVLSDTNEFGLAGIQIWNTHISVMEEYKTNNLQTNKAKKFIANNPMDLNVKGKNFIHWEPVNHKLIVFSNTGATIKDFANRRRAIPITFSGAYEWTEEKQRALNETAKDFLNFCYTHYKKCPMIINGSYFVLCDEDEKAFMKNELDVKNKDKLSKRAFSEECLKDYYRTDEYDNTEDHADFENLFNELIVEDEKSFITAKDLQNAILKHLDDNEKFKEYNNALEIKAIGGDLILNTKSKQWWKFVEYMRDKHSVTSKNKKVKGKAAFCYLGIKLKDADIDFV